MSNDVNAERLKRRILREYGRGVVPETAIDTTLQGVMLLAHLTNCTFSEKKIVPYVDIEQKRSAAEVFFIRFGEGADAAWVAFAVFMADKEGDGGWMNAYRVFSGDTEHMPWLENYVKEELAGV